MNKAKIIVRISKSGKIYNKGLKYFITSDGDKVSEINNLNDKIEYLVPSGHHVISVSNEKIVHKQELNLKDEEVKIITINPSVSSQLFLGIMIGIATAGSLISIIILKKISPILLIPLIPLLFIKKRNFNYDFALSTLD